MLLVGSKTSSVRTMDLVHDILSVDHCNVEQFHFSGKHNSKPFPNGPLCLNLQPCKNRDESLLWLNTFSLNFEGRTANGFVLLKKNIQGALRGFKFTFRHQSSTDPCGFTGALGSKMQLHLN